VTKNVDKDEILRAVKRRKEALKEERPMSYDMMDLESTDAGVWELGRLQKMIEVGVLDTEEQDRIKRGG